MINSRTITLGVTLAVSAAALVVSPIASSKGGPGVRVSGECTGNSISKLKVSREDGGIEVEFQVDQNRNGVPWKISLRRNGSLVAATTAKTQAPSGSFSLRRVIAGGSGTIVATATRASGERCSAHAAL